MKSFDTALNFRPARLPKARRTIQQLHPTSESDRWEPEPGGDPRLKARIERAARAWDPDRALGQLASSLTHRELRTAVRSIGRWTELRGPVAAIARQRPLPAFVPALWKVWEEHPGSDTVVDLLGETASEFGMERAVGNRYREDAIGWFQESIPVDSIVHWTGRRDIGWEELGSIEGYPFRPNTPLVEHVFHRTLQIGAAGQLLRMGNDDLLGGWRAMSGTQHMEACANFLGRIGPGSWNGRTEVLEEVRANYGLPGAEGSLRAFWDRVSEERRRDFREYFITRELDYAFKGDTDRHKFWMHQKRDILEVCHGTAGSTEWALIDFPGFSVVEFFELGNAAYLYPSDEPMVGRIRTRRRASYPSELKKIMRSVVPGFHDNRILHHRDWQYSADRILEVWKERYS